jgi:class 3 adenylate cyclase/tetratricopeptide (TPR) repeat protein
MKCPGCGQENPSGARFCNGCGNRLDGAAAVASPQAYTPRHLAEKILTSGSALVGERKQVTVLFADLKGSMELLAGRDPEEARRLLDAVLERMLEAVHRYEGLVNQVMGDGIMALFGAPVAHEDHAARACYAALRMQAAVSRYAEELERTEWIVVRIRVGINSGEVVVRSIGNDLHMDYTAVGQTTHLAARMEQMATPGSILISQRTLRLAEAVVSVQPLGARSIKGLDAPLEVYELVGAAPTRSILRSPGAHRLSLFVGRQAELERLEQILGEAGKGRGQLAAVTAEPGVGKSRLVYEFVTSQLAQEWRILEASSLSYEKTSGWAPVIELLRTYFELNDRDTAPEVAAKVSDMILALDRELGPSTPAILSLLDALPVDHPWHALDPRERRRRVLDALTRLIVKESDRRPLVLVLENLQWVDSETQAFLDALLEHVEASRLLLLVDYRPEFAHAWGSQPGFHEVPVPLLSPEAAEELLRALLGTDHTLASLRKLLIQRSGGNPYFLEEIVRTLTETRVLVGEPGAYRLAGRLEDLQVPATVQAVLAARIDRLPSDEKLLLQSAAVVGLDVPFALLEAVTDQSGERLRSAMAHLQAAGFLEETRLFPDLEYRFRTALTRDVGYESLLRDQRRALHARIVEAIEALYHDRLPSWIDQLAHHALRGEVWAKAEIYNQQVGQRAVARAANAEAVRAFEAALHAVGGLAQTRETLARAIDLRLELRPPLLQLGRLDDVLTVSREAERLARELGDEQRLARVYTYLVNYHYLKGETSAALDYGARCLAVGEATGDVALQTLARQYLGQSHHVQGDYSRAEGVLHENLTALDASPPGTSYVASCAWLAFSLVERGDLPAAHACLERALRAAAASQHGYIQAIAWTFAGLVSIREGHLAQAVLPLERSLELSRRKGLRMWEPIPSSLLGLAFVRMGHVTEGLRLLEESVALSRELGIRAYFPLWMLNLAEGYLAAGNPTRAAETAREALELALASGERGHEAYAHHLLGEIVVRGDAPALDEALEHYQAALGLAEKLGMRPLVGWAHLGLRAAHAGAGRRAEAETHGATGETLLHELGIRVAQDRAATERTELGHLFIVAPSNSDLYEFLTQEFAGDPRIRVVLDRRQSELRPKAGATGEEPGHRERRQNQIDEDLRNWGLAVAARHQG